MLIHMPSDGCEGDGGYIAPDGVILGAARPVIEFAAIVGTLLILIAAAATRRKWSSD